MIELIQIILASLIAGALDTVVGFGGGLLLMPILVATFGTVDAVILSAIIPLGWNLGRLPLLRKFIDLRTTGLFALGIIPGTFFAGLFLKDVNPDHLQVSIGVFLIILGLYYVIQLYVEIPLPKIREALVFPVVGVISGVLSALLGAGNGPLQTWTMSAAGLGPTEIVAVSGVLGALTGGVKLAAYGSSGLLRQFPWLAGTTGFAAALIGAVVGVRLSRRMRDSTLKLLIGLVIIAGGIKLVL